MKKHFFLLVGLMAFVFCGCQSVKSHRVEKKSMEAKKLSSELRVVTQEEAMKSIQATYQFLKDAGHYFIATVDVDQPRVRPFGTVHIFEDKLYIQTGRSKNVGKQLLKNGKVELCTMKGNEWIRVSGVLVDDPRREAKASMLEEYPNLKSMYSADDENTMVLYFKPGTGTATIWSFSADPVEMHF